MPSQHRADRRLTEQKSAQAILLQKQRKRFRVGFEQGRRDIAVYIVGRDSEIKPILLYDLEQARHLCLDRGIGDYRCGGTA